MANMSTCQVLSVHLSTTGEIVQLLSLFYRQGNCGSESPTHLAGDTETQVCPASETVLESIT